MKLIHAVYKNGAVHPTEPVELPEYCGVQFEPRAIDKGGSALNVDERYAVLEKRFESGEHDVAERHNEHQP